jgi:hypothetical protein
MVIVFGLPVQNRAGAARSDARGFLSPLGMHSRNGAHIRGRPRAAAFTCRVEETGVRSRAVGVDGAGSRDGAHVLARGAFWVYRGQRVVLYWRRNANP